MEQLKVGVVGLGLGTHFVSACRGSQKVGRLVVCDPDRQRREEAARGASIAAGYATIEEMLDAESLDAVCVVTPDHLHRPHVELCLDAGCHVLMTKPLATNLEDGRAIIRAAEASGRTVMVAHERRFRSRYKAVKELLVAGELGEVILVQADQLSDRRGQFSRAPWYASPEAGRTAIVGSGIHEVDLIRFLVGRPIRTVSASSNRLGGLEFPKSKTTATVVQFEGGAIGQTAISYEARFPAKDRPENRFLLVASEGVVHGTRVHRDGEEGWQELPTDEVEIAAGCGGSVDAFLAAVTANKPVPVPPRDAYATLAACIAADQSAETGETVTPDPESF
jgi:predicted dehydrogenase